MKGFKVVMSLCVAIWGMTAFIGCSKNEPNLVPPSKSVIDDIPQKVEVPRGLKCYYMVVNGQQEREIPNLTLFSDGTFGFSYDALSSYYAVGDYEVKDDKLIVSTEDGKYHYTFKKDDDNQYIFIADESSDVSLINKRMGVPIEDGAIFKLEGETMGAVVKEINEHTLLVSSREDSCPGAFNVTVPKGIDLSNIQGGDEVLITWDGNILETDPAQIEASYVELRLNTKVIA